MRKIAFLILFVGFMLSAKAQNLSLTIGEAFNWKVGDTLIYRGYTWGMYPQNFPGAPPIKKYTYYDFTGFEVLAKDTASDTLIYRIQFFDRDTSNIMHVLNPDSIIDSLHYLSALDNAMYPCNFNDFIDHSCVSGCQKHIDSSTVINGDTVIWIYNNNWLDHSLRMHILKPIGIKWIESSVSGEGACGVALAYYKSDSVEWRDQAVYNWVGINDISNEPLIDIYPNPVSDILYINGKEPVSKLAVYNLSGQMILSILPSSSEIDVSLLPAGSYMVNIETPFKNVVRRRFIKL